MKNKILVFFVGMASFLKVTAQTNLIEKELQLNRLYEQINESYDSNDWEKKSNTSNKFSNDFKKFISQNAATIGYDFKKLSKNIHIVTSQDKKLKIYSWDTEDGGTMKFFDKIIQYKSNNKVYTYNNQSEENDSGSFSMEIHTVIIENKVYYLVIDYAIGSSKDHVQTVKAYTIENEKLNTGVQLFQTKTKLLNEISVYFDFFSVVDREERPVKLIRYNDKNKTLYIPVVNEKGEVSNNFLAYTLKGNYFKYTGIVKKAQ